MKACTSRLLRMSRCPATAGGDYEAIEALADTVESNGGFMWTGDNIAVGDDILVGRDVVRLLTVLWKRAGEREGDGDSLARARKQGEEAARREVRALVRERADGRPTTRRQLLDQSDPRRIGEDTQHRGQ